MQRNLIIALLSIIAIVSIPTAAYAQTCDVSPNNGPGPNFGKMTAGNEMNGTGSGIMDLATSQR